MRRTLIIGLIVATSAVVTSYFTTQDSITISQTIQESDQNICYSYLTGIKKFVLILPPLNQGSQAAEQQRISLLGKVTEAFNNEFDPLLKGLSDDAKSNTELLNELQNVRNFVLDCYRNATNPSDKSKSGNGGITNILVQSIMSRIDQSLDFMLN